MMYPKSELTLSALPEVGPEGKGSPLDQHAACRTLIPPKTGERGDFWSKAVKTDCCWLWSAATVAGYGVFWNGDGKAAKKAHRVAYELAVGPIPDGLDVMHSCDVRRCIRPDHLEVGTRQKNQRDMVLRGRAAPQDGENNAHARFTWMQVRMVRDLAKLGYRRRDIADAFGTSEAYASTLVSQRTWKEREA